MVGVGSGVGASGSNTELIVDRQRSDTGKAQLVKELSNKSLITINDTIMNNPLDQSNLLHSHGVYTEDL